MEASGFMSWTEALFTGKMDAEYFQIIFFIIALISTIINVHNRFFTKRVITFIINKIK